MSDDVKKWISNLEDILARNFFTDVDEASNKELQYALCRQVLTKIVEDWHETKKTWKEKKVKMAYYLSVEFLMGRWLGNTLINLGLEKEIEKRLADKDISLNDLEDAEEDAGLGSGGLGRLAACFLDSLATMNYPAMGYGILYKYGMFKQKIENFEQKELPDDWLTDGNPYCICRKERRVHIHFRGRVVVEKDQQGHQHYRLVETDVVDAIPYDMPVVGYDTHTVGTLRLWQASARDGFNLDLFQQEFYPAALSKLERAENMSRVLYPSDRGTAGKTLRLNQQYFFSSASLQDIIRRYKETYGDDVRNLWQGVAIQLNDTHPVIVIPELMRLLLDYENLTWEEAWEVTTKTCAYTNHTIVSEALEKWPIELIIGLLPRHYQIIEEINRRFLSYLHEKYPGQQQMYKEMSIISHDLVHMAYLAIVGTHSVNGVAALHTDILKNRELKQWYQVFPEKFNNKTNGVTQRRWVLKANPTLSAWITDRIGHDWITDMTEISNLEKLVNDPEAIQALRDIKRQNKENLARYIKKEHQIDINPDAIFDVQIKRLHEYKRQLLNVLHILHLYYEIKQNPTNDRYPRVFIFAAKAASSYRQAKLIIKLINVVAHVVNNDASLAGKLKVLFLENYNVSLAERLIPASDVSEQISTAGYEASGTGNMKFMMNGTLTLGTMDGANVEIAKAVGIENIFIFGLSAEQVKEKLPTYHPQELLNCSPVLNTVVNMLLEEPLAVDGPETFRDIYNSLVHGVDGNPPDKYMVLQDFESYLQMQKEVEMQYRNQEFWTKKSLINIARSGRFSSDRAIQEYAQEIWHIQPCEIDD